ncbi:hypothetical protein [Francisella sp. SYW-9]|uniref:hypothetical protein n=1 Tax=Francisella sp. SYW-9 TaxID=2610888 RepID=UPI00123E396B|nr:hypothetical protein [Francisella sp. SYW-9]
MRNKVIFFLSTMSLSYSVVLADTTNVNASVTQADQVATNISSKEKASTAVKQISKSQDKSNTPKSQDTHKGDDLSIMVDTSNASYDALLADAEKILADRDNTKKPADQEVAKKIAQIKKPSDQEIAQRIAHINKHVGNKVVVEKKQLQQESMKQDVKAAGNILKRHDEINEEFKDSYGAYQGNKSTKDYITKESQGYNDAEAYQMKNYKNLLGGVKLETPKEIGESFDEIDNSKAKSKYKLSDGYSIEDVTTVGSLTGQDKRLKKCLIMKTYGGGTWRTYCQPLKKPTQCPDYDWNQLSTMAIMYC